MPNKECPEIIRQALSATWTKRIINCVECGNEFEARIPVKNGIELTYQNKCRDCVQAELRKKQEEEKNQIIQEIIDDTEDKWWEESGVFPKFCDATFENFDSKINKKAYDAVKNLDWKKQSMILSSPNIFGVGKTHLVHALIDKIVTTEPKLFEHELPEKIRKHECPVIIKSENRLLSEIRSTYNKEGDTEEDIYRKLLKYDLLIIDDVGKIAPQNKNFLQGVYFRIIDDRYNNFKTIILTTNLSFSELENHIGGSCADRLREMCGKNFITMKGESYRRKKNDGASNP